MPTLINKKIESIFTLLAKLAQGEELYSQDERLQEEICGAVGKSEEKALYRYLLDIHELYSNIVLTQKKKKEFTSRKVSVYRVVDKQKDVSDVFKFFLENGDDLSWVLQMIHENDPSFLKKMSADERDNIEKSIKKDEDIFLFKSTPFENFQGEKKQHFQALKQAVAASEYRSITYIKNETVHLKNVKCLKLVYMSNNWYLAVEDEEEQFRWVRLSFISHVGYASTDKNSYQKAGIAQYESFFAGVQNPMSLYGIAKKVARLKVSPTMALYFKEEMKHFFLSQKFVGTEEDGSIIFTVEYTQELEILPFIKQWLPSISIISPPTLKDALVKDLECSIELHLRD